MSTAPTISVPAQVVLIRVMTHTYEGYKRHAPEWCLLGTRDEFEYEYRWDTGKDLVLGEQGVGEYILGVTDLGLDPKLCLQYLEDTAEIIRLYQEEDDFNLHADNGPCLCGEIERLSQRRTPIGAAITKAVLSRYDAWTRRSHLVALADGTGMFAAQTVPAEPEPAEPEPAVQTTPAPIYKTASEWLSAV